MAGVQQIEINQNHHNQRIDNFLLIKLKNYPRSYIYKILRTGEVRVNKGRIKPSYRLQLGDIVRLPPLETITEKKVVISEKWIKIIQDAIIYQDKNYLVINKPSGLAVHAGSQAPFGIIEILRHIYVDIPMLELAHRLDQDTSGCLILAKNRPSLLYIQDLIKQDKVEKIYLCLVKGEKKLVNKLIALPLEKNQLKSGERIVKVSEQGKMAKTYFHTKTIYQQATLLQATLVTGRTHQIRVHCQASGFPIAGDKKYGEEAFNKQMKMLGLNRLFLHAYSIVFILPDTHKTITITSELPEDLQKFLSYFKN